MRILSITPTPGDGQLGIREVAKFDLQVTPECRILGCRLMRAPDGSHFIYGPMGRAGRTATFGHELAIAITKEAVRANDRINRAA